MKNRLLKQDLGWDKPTVEICKWVSEAGQLRLQQLFIPSSSSVRCCLRCSVSHLTDERRRDEAAVILVIAWPRGHAAKCQGFPQTRLSSGGKCWVVVNQRATRCSSSCFSCRASLRALNRPFSITSGGLKTAGDRETGGGDGEGERAWVKVIIWITAGNWITLHRGRLIGQQWVELRLDRWVHLSQTCRRAVPAGVHFSVCEENTTADAK